MKALLLLSTFCAIESFVITNEAFSKPPILKDLYIKKEKDILKRALNGPKLVNKPISKLKKYAGLPNKYPNNLAEYTVFPSHAKKAINVPSSLYFPEGQANHDEPKLRVKKVLPDFWNDHNRKKRSPENPIANTEKDDEAKIGKDVTNVPIATNSLNKDANETVQAKSNPEVGTDKEALNSSNVMMPLAQKNLSQDSENLDTKVKIDEDNKERVVIAAREATNVSYNKDSQINKTVDANQNIELKKNSAAGAEKEAIIPGDALKLLPKRDSESNKNDDTNQNIRVTKNSEVKGNVSLDNNSNLTTATELSFSKHKGTPRNINAKKTGKVRKLKSKRGKKRTNVGQLNLNRFKGGAKETHSGFNKPRGRKNAGKSAPKPTGGKSVAKSGPKPTGGKSVAKSGPKPTGTKNVAKSVPKPTGSKNVAKSGPKPTGGKSIAKSGPKPTGGKNVAKSGPNPTGGKNVAKSSPNPTGGKKNVGRRLIAARDALIENYPYAVSIQKDGDHWCAGALLNQRLVITTANCVWKSHRISRMRIRAGSRHVEHGGQLVNIAEVLKHPWWTIRKNPDYDVALLLTDTYIKFSHSCHALDLPNRAMMPLFDDAWVTSWGAERRDGVYIKQGLTLQVYHAPLLAREKCNNVTMRFGIEVSENFICLEQAGRRAPCTRDTGAPAVSDGVLWGLASWGIRKLCGTERFPAMFSYIASEGNMDFIINGTKYLMSEERLSPFLDRYPFSRVRNYSSRMHHVR